MRLLDGRTQFSIMLDYEFGVGTSGALPKSGLKFVYSKRSDRLKQVIHDDKLFATIRPNGVIAPTYYGACVLMKSKAYAENSVVVEQAAVEFVREGRSVFCKFVKDAGKHVLSSGEVAVLDPAGRVIAVGNARVHGDFMRQFKHGVAVKVRGTALLVDSKA
ncbi:MAG TPA: PUA domain-containing protein [Nitrososphaerales archaeon]|nr:PUA domain-containing protein [Nitrososphaerales archaeon]